MMAYLSINRVTRGAILLEKNLIYMGSIDSLQRDIESSLMPIHKYWVPGDGTETKHFLTLAAQVEETTDTLQEIAISEDEKELINDTKTMFAKLKRSLQSIIILENIVTFNKDMNSILMVNTDILAKGAIEKIYALNESTYEGALKIAYRERNYRNRTNLLLILYAALFVIDASVSGYFIWHSVSKPLKLLQDGVRTITHGKLDHRVSVQTRGEFKELADSFNVMVERLQGSFADLEEEKDKLHTILLNIVDGVVVADAEHQLLFMNPVAENIFGKRYGELKGKAFFGCLKEGDKLMKFIQSDLLPATMKVNHDSRVFNINAASIKRTDGAKIGYILALHDITFEERLREKLEELAITDGLTKLYNRSHFQQSLEYEFLKAQRYNTPLSLIMLDIDYFKSFNDEYGHQMGDIVIVTLAKLLKDTVRKIDIVARYGGEEFVAILPHTREKESEFLAERLREKTEEHIISSTMGHNLNITISLGVTTFFNNNFKNKDEFFKSADDALYKAKRYGRNRVAVSLCEV
jgi:diguanylate cyclase (GGDEF)-like protein/PAS domain S-box-containing protein